MEILCKKSKCYLLGVCDGHGKMGDKISTFVKKELVIIFKETLSDAKKLKCDESEEIAD